MSLTITDLFCGAGTSSSDTEQDPEVVKTPTVRADKPW